MKRRRLKRSVIYTIYVLTFVSVFSGIYFIEKNLSPDNTFNNDNFEYVSKTIFENELPVVANPVQVIRPYKATDVRIVKDFYDYRADAEKQENALLYYENTYLQNSGVSYSGADNFEVVAILDGKVIGVKEDNILGNVVEIRHGNDIISVYQSLSDVKVKEGDVVSQGDVIARSGNSNISKELNDHLHFELIIGGQNVNPEEYYNKSVSEI